MSRADNETIEEIIANTEDIATELSAILSRVEDQSKTPLTPGLKSKYDNNCKVIDQSKN